MGTTRFYYISGHGDGGEHFTDMKSAVKRARSIAEDLKDEGMDTGILWVMRMEIEWPITKATMLRVLSGHGYADEVCEVVVMQWSPQRKTKVLALTSPCHSYRSMSA